MKRMFKALALTLALVLCTGIAGCTSSSAPAASKSSAADGSAKFKILEGSLATEEYGIGFRKGDELCNIVNAAMKVLKADGTLAQISEKWFGSDITTIQPDAKALDNVKSEPRNFVLGLDDSFPPMGYRDSKNQIVGFDIDMATAVCKKLGWTLKLQPIDWDAKELELNSKNIDCIWNGMTMTDERKASMSCSDPYLRNEQVVVVKADSGYQSSADLAGKSLALQTGSSAEDALNSQPDFKKSLGKVNTFDNNMNCFMDLEQGSSDAVLVDSIVADWYITTGNLE
ncbi:MAG: transporter substrate-binding domain-containing protein [Oscillospiraceae bacterium]|nr:transporter substrate-binding domain-containing protein [Oscillospiraceae bacterium]